MVAPTRTWRACLCASALLLGCGFGDTPFEQVDPTTVVANPSWEAHVQPRIEYYCAACHDPDAQVGTSGGWDFSTCVNVLGSIDVIREQAVVKRSMPPGARDKMSAEDWAVVKRWSEGADPCPQEAN